jgi:2,3-dihydroxyphenylpropionate 1,2-dioxygenase
MSEENGIVGGVCMAHAPQFFTLPDSEDRDTVERVRQLAAKNGDHLKALNPDVTLVVANDHANQFLLHCVPSFAIHRGKEASGHFAGRDFRFDVDSDTATDLVRYLQDEKFDPAFTSTAELDYAFGIPLTFLEMSAAIISVRQSTGPCARWTCVPSSSPVAGFHIFRAPTAMTPRQPSST